MLGAAAGHKTQEAGPQSNGALKHLGAEVQRGPTSVCCQAPVMLRGKIRRTVTTEWGHLC